MTSTSTTVGVLAFNNPNNTGDFALLFNDGSQIGTTTQGGSRTYSFSGLLDGPYSVVTYTGRPQGTDGDLFVDIPGSNEGSLHATGTPVGNTFTLGVTHVIHTLDLVGGSFDINLTDIAGAPAGYVGGFQLTLIPEPTALVGGFLALGLLRRRKRDNQLRSAHAAQRMTPARRGCHDHGWSAAGSTGWWPSRARARS